MACVKKVWKRHEAEAECGRLAKAEPAFSWSIVKCRECKGLHIDRQKPPNTEPDWSKECENCGATPIVLATGMCGPCTFGEAETANGNW